MHGTCLANMGGIMRAHQSDTWSGETCEEKIEAMEIGGRPHCFKTFFQAAVLGAFSVACLLLGHQIAEMGKQPGAEKHLEEIFALRRARILRFCQKEKNLSHPPSPPLFLHHIEDLPGDRLIKFQN